MGNRKYEDRDTIYSVEYSRWGNMKRRCYQDSHKDYARYGGRGIKVCDRWLESFENFLEDMGPCPGKGYSLDRIDNDGDYCRENCRWATAKEQAENRNRAVKITYNGITESAGYWAIKTGIKWDTIAKRYHAGWSPEDIIEVPLNKRRDYFIMQSCKPHND